MLRVTLLVVLFVVAMSEGSIIGFEFGEENANDGDDVEEHPDPHLVIDCDSVRFWIYTRDNPTGNVEIKASNNISENCDRFNTDCEFVILIHELGSSKTGDDVQVLTNAYLQYVRPKCIIVGDYSRFNYKEIKEIGKCFGNLIMFLFANGCLDIQQVHIVGCGLGAHIGAAASNALYPVKVERITGLDTTGDEFDCPLLPSDKRLDNEDALYVDCMHTSCRGTSINNCTADFWVNGGHHQPGCKNAGCDHKKAALIYSKTILDSTLWPATSCSSVAEAKSGTCTGPTNEIMGEGASRAPGIYSVILPGHL